MKQEAFPLRERNELKYRFVNIEKKVYPIALICKVMEVARSGYYAWCKSRKSSRQKKNESLIPLVREVHQKSRETYGTGRMAEEIEANGTTCGRYKARTLMKMAGVCAKQKWQKVSSAA